MSDDNRIKQLELLFERPTVPEPAPAEDSKAHHDSWGEIIIHIDGWAFGIDATFNPVESESS